MKKAVVYLGLICFLFAITGCNENKEAVKTSDSNTQDSKKSSVVLEAQTRKLSKDDFGFLKKGMSLEEVKNRVGPPAKDVGSGLYIPQYDLLDGSIILLSFGGEQSLLSARLITKDGKTEEIILREDSEKILKSFKTDNLKELFDAYYERIDGAYAEGYGWHLLRLYKKTTPEDFVKELSVYEKSKAEGIAYLLVGEMFIDGNKVQIDSIENTFKKLRGSKSLKDKERNIVEKILQRIENCKRANGYNILKQIEIENLNDAKNAKVTLDLPEDWHAKEFSTEKAPDFQFKAEKNKNIRWLYRFEFFNDKRKDKCNQYGIEGLCGGFETLGYYRDQPESSRFPNHSQTKGRVYSGKTVFGPGEIFVLECDLPKELRTKEHSTYEMIYAWIPVNNEDLAYNLSISVPLGEKNDTYIALVKKMLGAR